MGTDSIVTIRNALDGLRYSQAEMEAAFRAFEEQDFAKENAHLRETLERLDAQLEQSREETAALRRAHEELAEKFKLELKSKRLAMLGLSQRQHMAYLDAGLMRERARIDWLYGEMNLAMANMSANLNYVDASERDPLQAELAALRDRVNWHVGQSRARAQAARNDAAARHAYEFDKIKNEPIDDAALGVVRQFFAWETFWGLKIISIVGALLLLLGVFTFGRYLYINMGPVLQCVAIFVFGLALMGTGEAFFRKKWRGGFALALTSSGSGMLILGAALGYMTLSVLPIWAALCICAATSLITFAASLRYNAQLVAILALIGGYLPIIAMRESFILFGAIYFTI